jgi:lipid II:glycine glycyltransferase (peptidoglycan interpeptide bridge formation enzyme)
MIYYRKKNGINISEIWYNLNEKPEEKTDIIRYKYVPDLLKHAFSIEEKFTLIFDLSKSEEELFSPIHKTTKYQINRAKERDGITCSTFFEQGEKNKEKLLEYIDFFNTFAETKSRTACTPGEFEPFLQNSVLCVRAAEKDSQILVMHSYIVSDGKARMHQSASHFRSSNDTEWRNIVGRANRLLHWDDMLYFKSGGTAYYDFGGIYLGTEQNEKSLIAKFKSAFGGERLHEYLYIVPVSFLGWLSIFPHAVHRILEKILWHFKKYSVNP